MPTQIRQTTESDKCLLDSTWCLLKKKTGIRFAVGKWNVLNCTAPQERYFNTFRIIHVYV